MDKFNDVYSNNFVGFEDNSQDILQSQDVASQSLLQDYQPPNVIEKRKPNYDMAVAYGNTAISGPRMTRAGRCYNSEQATDTNGNRIVEHSNMTRPAAPFSASRLVVFLEETESFFHYGRGEIQGLPFEQLCASFLTHRDRCRKYFCKIPAMDEEKQTPCLADVTLRVFARAEHNIRSDLLQENIGRIQNLYSSTRSKEGGGMESSYKLAMTNYREHIYASLSYPDLLNEERPIRLFEAAPVRRVTEDENEEDFQARRGVREILSQDSQAFQEDGMRSCATSTPKKVKAAWINPSGEINLATQEFDRLMTQLAGTPPRRSQRQADKNAAGGKGAGGGGTQEAAASSAAPATSPGGAAAAGGTGGGGSDDGSGSTISHLFSSRRSSSSSSSDHDTGSTANTGSMDAGALLGRSGIDVSKGTDVTAGKFDNLLKNVSPGGILAGGRKRKAPSGAGASSTSTPSKKKVSMDLSKRISGASATSWDSPNVQSNAAVQGVLNTSNPAGNTSLNTSAASSSGAANTSGAGPVVSSRISYPPAIAKETQNDLYERADEMVKPVIKVMDMKLKFVRTSLKTIKDRTRRTEENVSKMVTRLQYIESGIHVLAKGQSAVKRRNELQRDLKVPFNNEEDAYNAVSCPESQELLSEWVGLLPIRASHSQWADKVLQKLFNQESWFRVSYHNEDKPYELGKDHELWEFGILLLRVPPGILDVLGTIIKAERPQDADKLLLQLRNWIRNREAGRRDHMRRELQLR